MKFIGIGYCLGCGDDLHEMYRRSNFCFCCWQYKQAVCALVNRAIKRGQMPKPSGQCAWCDSPAKVWEHRDYSKPFDVVATCYPCNAKAPPAKMPDNIPVIASLQRKIRKLEAQLKTKRKRK